MSTYLKLIGKRLLFVIFLLFILILLIGVAAIVGSANVSIKETYLTIVGRLLPINSVPNITIETIVWELRLPRILGALIAGAGLAIAGAVLQVTLRNPLASPYTLGIASGAGFGAALAIILGAGIIGESSIALPIITNEYLVIINAFIFALVAAFTVYGLACIKGASPEILILAGVATMYFFSAFTSILQYLGQAEAVKALVFWLLGDLDRVTWRHLPFMSFSLLAIPFLISKSWSLNALSMGDEIATNLGVNVKKFRIMCMISASFITATIICFVGTIGFIGLISPHIVRMVIGSDNRFILPASMLVGANLLLASDTVARTLVAPLILPVGAVTSFIGCPFFIYLLMKKRREYWK